MTGPVSLRCLSGIHPSVEIASQCSLVRYGPLRNRRTGDWGLLLKKPLPVYFNSLPSRGSPITSGTLNLEEAIICAGKYLGFRTNYAKS